MLNRIILFLLLTFPSIVIGEVSLTQKIETLYYRGQFEEKDLGKKKLVFQEVLNLSEKNLKDLIEKTNQKDLFSLPVDSQVDLLKQIPDSHEVLFWATISWGVWGMTYGDFKAALNDVAGKCARYSELLIRINPDYRDGAGFRLLGRLHTVVPRVPFFTNWINREHGIDLLRKAVATSTNDLRNELFLAEALFKYKPEEKQFALELIKRVASQQVPTNNPEVLETILQARDFLKEVNN